VRQRHEVVLSFDYSDDIAHLFWGLRQFVVACNEGIHFEESRLAATFAYAFAPVGWTQCAEILQPLPVSTAALATLRAVGEVLGGHYRWPRFDPFARAATAREANRHRYHRGLFFSGGVDSCSALKRSERSVDWLVHVSNFENLDAHLTLEQQATGPNLTQAVAEAHGLGFLHLKTNFAEVFKHNRFDDRFPEDCSFWLGLQHVNHLATAILPVQPSLDEVDLAGGLDELHQLVGSCAASSGFVDTYRYQPGLRLVDETESRREKIERLLDTAPELLKTLRVCYSSGDGTCATCRKCQATALLIVSSGGHLADTSFPPNIRPALCSTILKLIDSPPAGNRFLFQALEGRKLCATGTRDRWKELLTLVDRSR
jgi:hypothetical protein